MGLNREGYALLVLFIGLLALLFSGFGLYGRKDLEARGGEKGLWKSGLSYFGAGPLPLLLFGLPGLMLTGGWLRVLVGLSLLVGCCLPILFANRFHARMEEEKAFTVHELLSRVFGKRVVLPVILPLLALFLIFLAAGGVSLLSKLFSSAFSLAYYLSVYFVALLLVLLALLSSPYVQRVHARFAGVALPACLLLLGVLLLMNGAQPSAVAAVGEGTDALVMGADLLLGLGAIGSIPLWHSLPERTGKGARAGFVLLQVGLWMLCLLVLALLALCSGAMSFAGESLSSAETSYVLFVQEGLSPLVTAVLLLAPLYVGVTGGMGALTSLRETAEEGCALLFPSMEGRKRRWLGALALTLGAGLSVLLAGRQESSVFALYSVGWAGMAACLGPLLFFALFRVRLRPLGCVLSPLVGAAAALAFGCVPALSSLVHPVMPPLILSIVAALPFLQGKSEKEDNKEAQ